MLVEGNRCLAHSLYSVGVDIHRATTDRRQERVMNMCTETAENATGAQGRDRVCLKIR